MKAKLVLLALTIGSIFLPISAQSFVNLNFEAAQVVSHDPVFGFLDWNLAAPGWSHSSGSDTTIVYYGQEHLGGTQYYMLYDSLSPVYAPRTPLVSILSWDKSPNQSRF